MKAHSYLFLIFIFLISIFGIYNSSRTNSFQDSSNMGTYIDGFLSVPIWLQICGGSSLFLIILFYSGIIFGGIMEGIRPPRLPSLGRQIVLSAMNTKIAYTSGICTVETEDGGLHVFYNNEREKGIAERNFPDADLREMDDEARFHFSHPSFVGRYKGK